MKKIPIPKESSSFRRNLNAARFAAGLAVGAAQITEATNFRDQPLSSQKGDIPERSSSAANLLEARIREKTKGDSGEGREEKDSAAWVEPKS